VRERTREAQRPHNLLEDAGIKITSVVSDVLGKSCRAMLEALIAGERDPHTLDRIDTATAMQNRLTARIDRLVQPYRRQVELLASVPGVSEHTAQVILAEIGSDIARFPSAGHLASWVGVCPGNNESAGKHSSGTTRPGDPPHSH
jgi:transposase